MRRLVLRSPVALASLILLVSGCDSRHYASPPGLKPSSSPDVEPSKTIFYVVPGPPSAEEELCGVAAQRAANRHRAIFRTLGSGPADPPSLQPEIVRKALGDGASALVIVPGDAPGLGAALAEADARKVPVILIARPVDPPAGSAPYSLVNLAPYEESARRIVSTTLEDAKQAGRPADGTVLIMVDQRRTLFTADRIAALKGAAESAGLRKIETVAFDGNQEEAAKTALLSALKTHGDHSMVLCDGEDALKGAARAAQQLAGNPPVFVGGFSGYPTGDNPSLFGGESCVIELRYDELGRAAVLVALNRLKGETTDPRIILESKFVRGTGAIGRGFQSESEFNPESKSLVPVKENGQAPPTGPSLPQ